MQPRSGLSVVLPLDTSKIVTTARLRHLAAVVSDDFIDRVVEEALVQLQFGLLDDLNLLRHWYRQPVESLSWDEFQVLGCLPQRFRHLYNARFTLRLVNAAFELVRDFERRGIRHTTVASAMLARWALDAAIAIGDLAGADAERDRRRMARSLGLCGANGPSLAARSAADPAGIGWRIDSIDVAPDAWFQPSVPGSSSIPGVQHP